MKKMKLLRSLFGQVLEPIGFVDAPLGHSILWRKVSAEINHVIGPNLTVRGDRFEVWVYPHSCVCSTGPDEINPLPGMPYFLNELAGVSSCQQSWPCGTEEELTGSFETEIKPLILTKAIPYLDQIKCLADMLPLLEPDPVGEWFRGIVLLHCGRRQEAKEAFLKERERILQLKTELVRMSKGRSLPSFDPENSRLDSIEELLGEM